MTIKQFFTSLILSIVLFSCSSETDISSLKGDYLGQKPPSNTPEIFAPGIISHGFHELGLAISPDMSEMFYISSDRNYSHYVILNVKKENNEWSYPELAHFTGNYSNYALAFSPNGQSLYFSSKRPVPGSEAPSEFHNIWRVDKQGNDWSDPIFCDDLSSEEASQINPSFTMDGTIYFQISHPQTGSDLYYAKLSNGKYLLPEKLNSPVNTENNESRPFISPDENFLLFHSNRPGTIGGMDIFISFKNDKGVWEEPINLGEPINSEWSDFGAYISPDGKYLFFSSYRSYSADEYKGKNYKELLELYRSPKNGYATLYWVDASVIAKKNFYSENSE